MDKFQIHFEIKYIALIIGLLLTVVGVAIYLHWGESIPQVKEIMAIVGGGLALTGLLYSAMNLHHNLRLNEQKLINERKVFSALLIAEWHKPEMTKLTIIGAKLRMSLKNLDARKVLEFLKQDSDAHNAMVAMLNFFEKMAICIENDVADEQLLKDFFQGIIRGYYTTLRGLIQYKRIELEDQNVCIFFEKLAVRWNR